MIALVFIALSADPTPARDDGYRGIWYSNQPTRDEFAYKYSGGLATYPQQHAPIAVYSSAANKTFFVYGGRPTSVNQLRTCVGYFDHATGTVPRPTALFDKPTDDAHDNPVLNLDAAGHLWVFGNAHGTDRPAFIYRGTRPYSIEQFELVARTNFSYAQPWHFAGRGFLVPHTRYDSGLKGRPLFLISSAEGREWTEPRPMARFGAGHYQVTWKTGDKLAAAFDYHPIGRGPGGATGLNARTNLYYLETTDFGGTWRTADGTVVDLPLTEPGNPALVREYEAEGSLVYIKDLQFDAGGRPIILYLTSRSYQPGPVGDPRTWHTAHWTGRGWQFRTVTTSDHNYDHGSLYIDGDQWEIIAPTDPGPKPYLTGGDMVRWLSPDAGQTWQKYGPLTRGSRLHHTYARRPLDAHADFWAFWADGDPTKLSESSLYFAHRDGRVFRLPRRMARDFEAPERVH